MIEGSFTGDLGQLLKSGAFQNDPRLQSFDIQRMLELAGLPQYYAPTEWAPTLQGWQTESNSRLADSLMGTEFRLGYDNANTMMSGLYRDGKPVYEENQADVGPDRGFLEYLTEGFVAAGLIASGAAMAGAWTPGATAGVGAGAAGAAEGAFTLPVSSGAVGPASEWASLAAAAPAAATTALPAATAGTGAAAATGATTGAGAGAVGAGTGAATGLFGTGITGNQLLGGAQLLATIKGLNDAGRLSDMAAGADAFQPYRAGYAAQLQDLVANPGSVTKLPGYEFGLQESEKALTRNLASQGLTGSGTAAKALTDHASSYARKAWQDQLQVLAGLSGANMNNVGIGMQAEAASLNAQNAAYQNLLKIIPLITGKGG